MNAIRTASDADAFAQAWIDAWNAHDVDAVANHYAEDVEYSSPFVAELAPGGRLFSRGALREYVAAGLQRFPDLRLGPIVSVAVGDGSIAIVYWSVNNQLAVETLVFDSAGLIARAYCHYRADARMNP